MKNDWPIVPLGEVLTRSSDWVAIDPQATYREVTVRLWGRGVTLRRECTGSEIKSDRRLRVRPNQFIASRIDARNGAFGLIPQSLDGAVVTNDFPVFDVNPSRLLPQYLGWMSRTHGFVEMCTAASEGTTNRVRLKEDRFLAERVPLPPLPEQRRIAARIEALAAKIAEARARQTNITEECEQLCRSPLFDPGVPKTPTRLRELVERRPQDISVEASGTYDFAGIYCFGGGMFKSGRKSGMDFAYRQLTTVRAGDFVYPKLMAWEGALTIAPPDFDGLVVSPEFPVFRVRSERVLPEVLDVYFKTPTVWPTLSGASIGTNMRRKRLNPDDFLAIEFPLPSMAVQRKISDCRQRIAALKQLQRQSAAELDALLPSILDRAFKGEL